MDCKTIDGNMIGKDCDYLVDLFQKLHLDKNDKNNKPEFIYTTYPGSFYRKTIDDGKVKVFQRGSSTKIYVYPPSIYDKLDKLDNDLFSLNLKMDKLDNKLKEINDNLNKI
jgi:hypothetical protein